MSAVQIGKWNIDKEWAASQSEEEFVAYATVNFKMSEAEARKAYAQLNPQPTRKTRQKEQA